MMHLTAETALDLIEGRLTSDERAVWEAHAQACKDCENEIEYWKRALGMLE